MAASLGVAARARLSACSAEFRLACAVFSESCAAVGSTFASTCPLPTWSPTFTSISVTVPLVVKSALAVDALCTVPDADTVATTSPTPTATARWPDVEVEVVLATVTVWKAQTAPTTASTPSPALTALGQPRGLIFTRPPVRLRPGPT